METLNFTLKNADTNVHNDTVYRDRVFDLNDQAYLFKIKPFSEFWRFGIRFSRTKDIPFFHPEKRYDKVNYIPYQDLHLGVGDWDNQKWSKPGSVYLIQYNFEEQRQTLNSQDNYVVGGEINWFIQYIPDKKSIYVSYTAQGCEAFSGLYPLDEQFEYFQVFAWADSFPYIISCELDIIPNNEIDHSPAPFRIDNVIFRLGDMFDHEVITKTNLLLLPASSEGTTAINIINRASELGIPGIDEGEAGSIKMYDVSKADYKLFAGYAYSVSDNKSSEKIIKNICKSIIRLVRDRPQITAINLPLFGAGAGRLNPVKVASVFRDIFNTANFSTPIFVSVQNDTTFLSIKNHFNRQYIPLPHEFSTEKPKEIKILESETNTFLYSSDYRANKAGKVIELNLSRFKKISVQTLLIFKELQVLNLSYSNLNNYSFLSELKELKHLYLSFCKIKDLKSISRLIKLQTLDLNGSRIGNLEFLKDLTQLKSLQLRENGIENIGILSKLKKLEHLDLSYNNLFDVSSLSGLILLTNLNIAYNRISDISFLKRLKSLAILDLSFNIISDASVILKLDKLNYLKIHHNHIDRDAGFNLDEKENHLTAVKNQLLKRKESKQLPLKRPVKVLLLGNHASGKSSLLYYMQNGDLAADRDSTHVIRIERYPQSAAANHEAIFYDFGGQDYYHGIYRAFLSGEAIYLILWQISSNSNRQVKDRNGVATQDFKLDYWLWQKKYLEQEKFGSHDPVMLIQTHAYPDPKQYFEDTPQFPDIRNDFYVDLKGGIPEYETSAKNKFALQYLKASIDELITERQINEPAPLWYIDFFNFILTEGNLSDHRCKDVVKDILPYYKRDGKDLPYYLEDDLDQLHKQGIILYYKDELPNKVWLNPVALVTYIHTHVLTDQLFKKSNAGEIDGSDLAGYEPSVIELLVRQKVIFKHLCNGKYLVPNYLPLASDNPTEFNMFTFGLGEPLFVLKFKHFIPFGFINQVICSFGLFQDYKKFWRDQVLFTLDNQVKILIKVNFQTLEVKVYANFVGKVNQKDKESYIKYLFYSLLALYWDFEIMTFNEFEKFDQQKLTKDAFDPSDPLYEKYSQLENLFTNSNCRPLDLFISLDDQYFFQYAHLCDSLEAVQMQVYKIDEQRNISEESTIVPIYQFQPFATRPLLRPMKAVISYSKMDIEYVHKFKQYLVPLSDDGLIQKPWYCTELVAGREWDDEIQQKFNDADIIFFMISEHLLANQYVKDHEIKNAIDRWDKYKNIRIVPILLVPYHWTRKGTYNLGRFTALPYTALPISRFPNQHMAWDYITEAIRVMIEQDLYPGSPEWDSNADVKQFFEKVIKLRKGLGLDI